MAQQSIETLDSELNDLIREGKILDGLDRFYGESCSFQEGNEAPIEGKATQRDRLLKMFSSLKSFNGATLHSRGIGDDVTHTEWTFDMTGPEEESIIWNEVITRHWKDGEIVRERFYQA